MSAWPHRQRADLMLALTVLYLSLGYALHGLVMEEANTIYKDFRFWLVLFSAVMLAVLTLRSYPL